MKKSLLILLSLFTTVFMISCTTIKEISEEKTSAQIIQMGQNAVSDARYKDAEFCFLEAINRFGSDPKVYAEAKYELGHCFIKQKKYEKAYIVFTELLAEYDNSFGTLPPAYKKLSLIGINKIPKSKREKLEK